MVIVWHKTSNHREVAPVIATLLMVAIAVVGGTIIFVFAENNYNTSQISGVPTIEHIQITGFDARDTNHLRAHDGNLMSTALSGSFTDDGKKGLEERVVVYFKNNSIQKITISELNFAGNTFTYVHPSNKFVELRQYAILSKTNPTESVLQSSVPIVQAGEEVTLVIGLDNFFKFERSVQFKLTTTNNAVVVGTVIIDQKRG